MSSVGRGPDPVPRALAAFAVFLLVPGALAAAVGAGSATDPGAIEDLILITGVGFLSVLVIGVVRPPRARFLPAAGIGLSIAAYAATLLVWVPFVVVVLPRLLDLVGIDLAPQPQLAYFVGTDPWRLRFAAAWATICVIGPAAEEVLFRGYLRDLVRALLGPAAGLWLTALLFGLFHGVAFLLPLGLLGLLFGWLRERTGSLAAPFVAHVLHNGLTTYVALSYPQVLEGAYR